MNTVFIIDGGAGRVINCIPALEKYEKLNPNDDFKVIVNGWEQVFWSHPTLQSRTFGSNQKGNFGSLIKNAKVIAPEPYHNNNFFNQRINLAEAFDEIINNTENHDDLNYNCLHLTDYEIAKSAELVETIKLQKKKKKLILFQPFGSGAELSGNKVIDRSNRSFQASDYFKIVQTLSNDAAIVYASMPEFKSPLDNISVTFDNMIPYHRSLMCMTYHCDYFIGCCSIGQHVARAFNKPGLVAMGGTSENNFSYPNHFKIFRKPNRKNSYVPWRLSEADCEFADRDNDGIMNFTTEELNSMIKLVRSDIGLSVNHSIIESGMKYD